MFKKLSLFIAAFWAIGWVIAGVVLGTMAYRHIAYPFYFLVPFGAMTVMALVPSSLVVLLILTNRWKTRFIWAAAYILAIATAYAAPQLWRAHYESPRDGGPYLVWAGDPKTSVTVCWSAEIEAAGLVEFTSAESDSWQTAQCPPTHYPKVALTGLLPANDYRYRIPALGSDSHTFRTAPDVPEDFAFAVYGDNRHEGGFSFHRSVIEAIEREEPEHGAFRLIVNSGDIVESPGAGYGWQWHTFLRGITPLASSRPYEVSLGNHEARGSTAEYEEYFNYGTPNHWRFVDYAGVRFIALSTQDPLTTDSPQYAWLVKALDERPPDNRFTVVTMHKPLLTYDPREHYNDPKLRADLEPLFSEKGVDIVFAGHVHAYERHHLPAFEHVISGGGGVLLWNKPEMGPETIVTETCWHFCAVDVRDRAMSVRVVRTDGSVLDEFNVLAKER
jgi:hypothetical protein